MSNSSPTGTILQRKEMRDKDPGSEEPAGVGRAHTSAAVGFGLGFFVNTTESLAI